MIVNKENLHNRYHDCTRHWHPLSEPYASGEQLQQMLHDGWELDKVVFRTEHHLKSSYRTTIFYVVVLWRNGIRINMPVLVNPFIENLIAQSDAKLVNVERRQPKRIHQDTFADDGTVAATG